MVESGTYNSVHSRRYNNYAQYNHIIERQSTIMSLNCKMYFNNVTITDNELLCTAL